MTQSGHCSGPHRLNHGKSIQAGRNYRLLPSFVCQALELTAVEAAHERYHLHHRTYCGDYGHSVVPRIALATDRR